MRGIVDHIVVAPATFNAIPVTELAMDQGARHLRPYQQFGHHHNAAHANQQFGQRSKNQSKSKLIPMNLEMTTQTKKNSVTTNQQQINAQRPFTDIDTENDQTALNKHSEMRMNTDMETTEKFKSHQNQLTEQGFDDSRIHNIQTQAFPFTRATTIHVPNNGAAPSGPVHFSFLPKPKTPSMTTNQIVSGMGSKFGSGYQTQARNAVMSKQRVPEEADQDIQGIVETYREQSVTRVNVDVKQWSGKKQSNIVRSTKNLTTNRSQNKLNQWQHNKMNKPLSGKSRESRKSNQFFGQQPLPVSVQGLIPRSSVTNSKNKLTRDMTSNNNLNDTAGSPKLVINMKSIDNDRESYNKQTHERDENTMRHAGGRYIDTHHLHQEKPLSGHSPHHPKNMTTIFSHNSLSKVKQSRQTSSYSTAGLFTQRPLEKTQPHHIGATATGISSNVPPNLLAKTSARGNGPVATSGGFQAIRKNGTAAGGKRGVSGAVGSQGTALGRGQHDAIFMDWQCFDYKIMERSMGDYAQKLEELAGCGQLQVILVKLWDLGKYIRQQNKLISELTVQARRNEEKVTQHKVEYLINKVKNTENIPLRVLTLQECHNLLGKIVICMYIVYERALCVINKIFNMEKLSQITKEKDEVEFKYFKIMIIALFGNNMFHLSVMDIDSILRKVHKELLISTMEEAPENDNLDQKCGREKPKIVTDEDLANLCNKPVESLRTLEKRKELQKELLSKQRLISFSDLLEHVGRVKFGQFISQKDEAIFQLKGIIESIFYKADYANDGPSLLSDDDHKNISKVREFIKEFWKRHREKKNQEEPQNILSTRMSDSPDQVTSQQKLNMATQQSIDIWTEIYNQKQQLIKSQTLKNNSNNEVFSQVKKQFAPISYQENDKVIQPKLKSVIQNFNLNINKFDPQEMLVKVSSNDNFAATTTDYTATLKKHLSPLNQATNFQTTTFSNNEQYQNTKSGDLRIKSAYAGCSTTNLSKELTSLHYSNQLLHDAINTVTNKDRGTRGLFSAAEPKRMKTLQKLQASVGSAQGPGNDEGSQQPKLKSVNNKLGGSTNQKSSSTLHGKSKSQVDAKRQQKSANIQAINQPKEGTIAGINQFKHLGTMPKVKSDRIDSIAAQLNLHSGSSANLIGLDFPSAQNNPQITSQRGIRIRSRLESNLSIYKRGNAASGASRYQSKMHKMKSAFKTNRLASPQDRKQRQKSSLGGAIDPEDLSLSKTLNSTIQPVKKVLHRKRNLIGKLAKKTNESMLNKALDDLKKDMLTENLVSLLQNSQYNNSLENMLRVSEEHGLGYVFMGSQKDHKYVYSPKSLQTGLIESNISNYRQVIQKVGYRTNKFNREYYQSVESKDQNSDSSKSRFRQPAFTSKLDGNFKKAEKIIEGNQVAKSNPLRNSQDVFCKEQSQFPVRLYKRKPSTPRKVVNYYIKQHLQASQNAADIYVNSTVNDQDLRTFYSTLNKNEVIKDQATNIPRFGMQGNKCVVGYQQINKVIAGSSLVERKRNLCQKLVQDKNFSEWNVKFQKNRMESKTSNLFNLQSNQNLVDFKNNLTNHINSNKQLSNRVKIKKMKTLRQNEASSSENKTHEVNIQLKEKDQNGDESAQFQLKHAVTIVKDDSTNRVSQTGAPRGSTNLNDAMSPSERILGRTSYGDETPNDIKVAILFD